MKRILIISFYFPPCNLTPSERILSFAEYFEKYGLKPTVVTRNWDRDIKSMKDEKYSSGEKIEHKVFDNYEVYYVPYKNNLKDELFIKTSGTKFYPFYLISSFIYSVLENFTSAFSGLSSLYNFSEKLLKKEDYDYLLISASPFHLFKFGYELNKKFSIKWIADYRDDWNTSTLDSSSHFFKDIVKRLSTKNEIKWVKSSVFFTCVTSHLVDKIESLVKNEGYVIANGFVPKNYSLLKQKDANNEMFTISYVGSLYHTQPIEVFVNATLKFIEKYKKPKIIVNFIGLKSQDDALSRIQNLVTGCEQYFNFTDRVSKQEAIQMQIASDVLLCCSHSTSKGIPGSKLYEYVALRKPVIVCPTDNDIMEEILEYTGQGIILTSTEECFEQISEIYEYFGKNGSTENYLSIDEEKCKEFSRERQTRKLAERILSK